MNIVLDGASFSAANVVTLSQAACTQSSYRAPTAPNKPIFLKELQTFANFAGLSALENILLIDDSPIKNLLNDAHSAVFPRPYRGESDDSYLHEHLMPWLDGLFKSNEAVPQYVKHHPLFGGQCAMDPVSREGFLVLKGTMPK